MDNINTQIMYPVLQESIVHFLKLAGAARSDTSDLIAPDGNITSPTSI
jgi:hypothetical protein